MKDKTTFLGWLEEYGPDKIILGADAMEGKIAVSGWQETSSKELIPFIKAYLEQGIRYTICTDISKDGMMAGPATELYASILEATKKLVTSVTMSGVEDGWIQDIKLIASGGITTMDYLIALEKTGCEGAIIGKALYEDRIDLKELETYISGAWNG